jgi:hypothetical protein
MCPQGKDNAEAERALSPAEKCWNYRLEKSCDKLYKTAAISASIVRCVCSKPLML